MLLFLWVRAYVRAYEEYLHSWASRITNGQTLVRHDPPPLFPLLPSLRIIRHTCDCRGISNVGVLLTLTYITCVVLGGGPSCVRQNRWIHKD